MREGERNRETQRHSGMDGVGARERGRKGRKSEREEEREPYLELYPVLSVVLPFLCQHAFIRPKQAARLDHFLCKHAIH
jgi:hypothetical protein